MLRVLFMGTGEIAEPSFQALLDSQHELVGLVTQPDRPVGRHQRLAPPRIKELAVANEVSVFQPESLRSAEALARLQSFAADLIVVMAYGQILPVQVLAMPPVACINIHASLLPRHRGASCLQAAIDHGDAESGVTIMHMAKGLDTGDLIASRSITLAPEETGGSLHDQIAELAPPLLLSSIDALEDGSASRTPQDERLATYAPKLLRGMGELDWKLAAAALERRIRAYHPWPGTFTRFQDERGRPRRLKIFPGGTVVSGAGEPGTLLPGDATELVVACGQEALALATVQADGGRKLSAAEFLAGHRLEPGERLFSLEQDG